MDEHLLIPLIERLNRGDCVLFVGEACDDAPDCAPAQRLAQALAQASGGFCDFCRPEGRCLRPHNCSQSLPAAAQAYEALHGRQALLDFVRRQAAPPQEAGAALRLLAALPVRVMLTTLQDERLEAALRRAGKNPVSVVRDTDIPFGDPRCVQVIHLHGLLSQPDSLVLTRADTLDMLGRLRPGLRTQLLAYFASSTLLFVGYSLGGDDFAYLYRQAAGEMAGMQRRSYAVQWPPDELARRQWQGRIEIFPAELLPFLQRLAREVRGQQAAEQRQALPPEPYKFLDYYTAADAAIFYGRDLESGLLLSTVLAHRLSVFYGRSGSGKTSLLLAGLGGALRERGYRLAYARMLGDPASEVKAAVRGLAKIDDLSLADRGRSLAQALIEALAPGERLALVLDQFEEFFVRQGPETRAAFAKELAACLQPLPEERELRLVLSLRDDYLGALDELAAHLPEDVFAHRRRLENLTREKAELAITSPARAFGLPVQEALPARLLDDLEDQGLETASLQVVLYRLYRDAVENGLWRSGGGPAPAGGWPGLTVARYQALGGVRAILSGYLDEVIQALPGEAQRRSAQAVLKAMITAQRTKAAVSGQEVARAALAAKLGLSPGELDELLGYLRQKRVVRKFGEQERYELAHEVLVEKVWAWVSDEELRLLEVSDMLRRGLSDFDKFGHLLSLEKLALAEVCQEALEAGPGELELLLRSSLAHGRGPGEWGRKAPALLGKLEGELLDELEGGDEARAGAAVQGLAGLASPGLVERLARRVEDDFDNQALTGYDYLGQPQRLLRTILNLRTPRQRRAAAALARLALPEAAQALGRWTPPGMVLVPAGPFMMGSEESGEDPPHEVWLEAFWVERYPATVAQYARFLESGAARRRELWTEAGWKQHQGQAEPREWQAQRDRRDHPVTGVTWYQSLACARWMGKELLSEAQWEKAASWELEVRNGKLEGRKREYPWGDEFDQRKCNTSEAGIKTTTPVGSYSGKGGDSPWGCADMAGNVWEWCRNLFVPYPYKAGDGREVLEGTGSRVLRGGSFISVRGYARCTRRLADIPDISQGSSPVSGLAAHRRIDFF